MALITKFKKLRHFLLRSGNFSVDFYRPLIPLIVCLALKKDYRTCSLSIRRNPVMFILIAFRYFYILDIPPEKRPIKILLNS